LKATSVESQVTENNVKPVREYLELWVVNRRQTVKEHSGKIIISGNRDAVEALTISCLNLTKSGNDPELNQWHIHHDWKENTSKSLGITLCYWHSVAT